MGRDELLVFGVFCGIPLGVIGLFILFVVRSSMLSAKAEKEAEKEKESNRVSGIIAREQDWGREICRKLMDKDIDVGMTQEMVEAGLGSPDARDNIEETENVRKERWIYGVPRRGATYIWFKNGVVTRIKT
jgi:hypothetical protein